MTKIQAFLRAFYTVHYIDDAKWRLYVWEKYSLVLSYKEGDVMLNVSTGERSQGFACCRGFRGQSAAFVAEWLL